MGSILAAILVGQQEHTLRQHNVDTHCILLNYMSEYEPVIKVLDQAQQIFFSRRHDKSEKGIARNGEIDYLEVLVFNVLKTLPVASVTPEFIQHLRELLAYCAVLGLRQTPLLQVLKVEERGYIRYNKHINDERVREKFI